jgi:hypothetical protein
MGSLLYIFLKKKCQTADTRNKHLSIQMTKGQQRGQSIDLHLKDCRNVVKRNLSMLHQLVKKC